MVQSHCIYFLIIALGLSLFGLGHALVASIIYNKISLIIKEVILDRIFLLDAEFFHTNKTGDVITKLDNDVLSIQTYIMSVLNTSMSNFLSFLGAMIYIGYVQWRMLVVGFLVSPFVGLAIYVFRNVLYSKDKKARELKSDVNDAIINSVDNSKPESFETICLSNVSFSYPRQDHLLNRIDAQFGKGWNVLGGRNGVGKSSLIDLLMKISSPSEGRILIDGVDIAPINNRS